MKISGWDILAIIFLLAAIVTGLYFVSIFADPSSAPSFLFTPTLPPTIFVPSATSTRFALPPTYTATEFSQPTLRPSSTPLPTRTGFVLPTFTPTFTPTRTVTMTYTVTNTKTPTLTPTINQTATFAAYATTLSSNATKTAEAFTPPPP